MRTTSATAAALAVAVLPIRAETFQKVQTEVRDRSGADIRWEKQRQRAKRLRRSLPNCFGSRLPWQARCRSPYSAIEDCRRRLVKSASPKPT